MVDLYDFGQLDIFPLSSVEEYAIGCLIACFRGIYPRFYQCSNMEL